MVISGADTRTHQFPPGWLPEQECYVGDVEVWLCVRDD